uniref:Uncharacterized protein n=1 Tax=viral metagenome TaxID=1070528 RepID=A0A6C0HN45_9ZZZZ
MTKQATPMQRAKREMLIWLCAVLTFNFTTGTSDCTKNGAECEINWTNRKKTGKRLQKMKREARKKIRASGISIQREKELFHSINGRLQSGPSHFDFENPQFSLTPKDKEADLKVKCPLTGREYQCIPGNADNDCYEIDCYTKYLWSTTILTHYLEILCFGINAIIYFPATITKQIIIHIDFGMYDHDDDNVIRLTFDQTASIEQLAELKSRLTNFLASDAMQPFADTLERIKPISKRKVELFFSGSTVCAATVFEAASLIHDYLADPSNQWSRTIWY